MASPSDPSSTPDDQTDGHPPPHVPPHVAVRFAGWLRRSRLVKLYLALLIASHLVIAFTPKPVTGRSAEVNVPGATAFDVEVPEFTELGVASDNPKQTVAGLRWLPDSVDEATPVGESGLPVMVLLHGSPSSGATDFRRYGPAMAAEGFEVIAFDRPGYGRSSKWVDSYSIEANAYAFWAALDELGVERPHLVGWSLSGGVILRMWDQSPERVRTLTLLGAIGSQQYEGSGSYVFEHVKYAVGYGLAVALPEAVPHFGLLGSRSFRHAFIRDFWDLDQRPLEEVMTRVHVPTLVLHGRDDPLVPDDAAERHHELIGPSRLVMLDASHFFPLGNALAEPGALEDSVQVLAGFALRHHEPGTVVRRGVADYAPLPPGEAGATIGTFDFGATTPWWILIGVIILATFISEDLTVVAVGLLIVTGELDYGVGLLGCFLGIVLGDYGLWAIGRFGGRRLLKVKFVSRVVSDQVLAHWGTVLERHTAKAVFVSRMLPGTRLPMYLAAGMLNRNSGRFLFWVTVAVLLWTPVLLILTALIGPSLLGFFKDIFHGPWAYLAAFVALVAILRIASLEATETGRGRLKAGVKRLWKREIWPGWAFYAPLLPYLVFLAIRHCGAAMFTHANPGIAHGGGAVNEPKTDICDAMEASGMPVLIARRLAESDDAKARLRALNALQAEVPALAYPVVVKPEAGEKGKGVRVVANDDEALALFQLFEDEAQVQQYHPGPFEFGVLWARDPGAKGPIDERPGSIMAITRKTFPELVGDGEHDIEALIWKHPRYCMQGKLFARRFEARLEDVLDEGEALALTRAGNHTQGCIFSDGMDLLTPELEAAVERMSQGFRGEGGKGLDFGRYDVRAASEDEFRAGRFTIIELNGTLAEATSIYDPGRSFLWTYRLLYRQWRTVYALGAARRAAGTRRGFSSVGLLREAVRSKRGRGSHVAV